SKGLLYRVPSKTVIKSVHEGRVAFTGPVDGHRLLVVLDHGDHYYTVYGMSDKVLVKKGDKVKGGESLAETSEHAYFEIRHFSDAIDPRPWLVEEGASS